jgi:hypothetical protein
MGVDRWQKDKSQKGSEFFRTLEYEASTNRCLVIEHEQEFYIGCIHLENRLLCDELYELLTKEIGQSLASIGALDIDALWPLTRYGLNPD